MYQLKDIQRECALKIHNDLFKDKHNRVLASIATGWGKTILASKMCEAYIKKYNFKCLFLANRSELISQTVDKFYKASDIICSVEQAGKRAGLSESMVVASCQTMAKPDRHNRFSRDHFDFIIIDEAHGALCDQYQVILNYFDSKYLFLTATADKLVDAELFDIIDKVSYEFTLSQSVKAGYNVKPIVKPIFLKHDLIDLNSLDDSSGDKLLEKVMPLVYQEMQKYCHERKSIIFLPNIERSKKTQKQLEQYGFNSFHCDGYLTDSQRRKVLDEFAETGHGSIMCNPCLLGTGYDQPDIDCVIVLRNVASRALYAQMVGRALRVSTGKDHGIILDFLGLTKIHNITASIEELQKLKRVFQDMGDGGDIDLIESDRQALHDAEKALALKLLEQQEKEQHKNLVSIEQVKKIYKIDVHTGGSGDITPQQVKALNALGVSIAGLKTFDEAKNLYNYLHKRDRQGLATPKQLRAMRNSPNSLNTHYTKSQAKDIIMGLKRNNWRRW